MELHRTSIIVCESCMHHQVIVNARTSRQIEKVASSGIYQRPQRTRRSGMGGRRINTWTRTSPGAEYEPCQRDFQRVEDWGFCRYIPDQRESYKACHRPTVVTANAIYPLMNASHIITVKTVPFIHFRMQTTIRHFSD